MIKYFQLLSLDIALGSVVIAMVVARLLGVTPVTSVYLALFLCVWMIYTLDHLLDAKKSKGVPSMDRHRFHFDNGSKLFIILLLVAILSLALLPFLPVSTLLFGAITAGLIGIYFLLAWWLRILLAKELIIAILYALGVCIPSFALIETFNLLSLCLLGIIASIALINLLVFSLYDMENDQKDGYHSWATIHGEKKIQQHITVVFGLAIFFGIVLFMYLEESLVHNVFMALITLMTIVLALIWKKSDFIKNNLVFRLIGDGIFFIPGLILFIE